MQTDSKMLSDFFPESIGDKKELKVRITGKQVEAIWWKEYVQYQEALSKCAASNRKVCKMLSFSREKCNFPTLQQEVSLENLFKSSVSIMLLTRFSG